MNRCLYYWLIEPLREEFQDTSESVPVFTIPVKYRDKGRAPDRTCHLSVFIDAEGLPSYARFEIPGLTGETIPNEFSGLIHTVREHLLSIIRLTYHPDAALFPRPFWSFVEENIPHSVGLKMTMFTGQLSFDAKRAKPVFEGTFKNREEIRLLIDGLDRHIPLQYRFLSFYKLIEFNFKKGGSWEEGDLEALFQSYQTNFQNIGVLKKPASYIHELRDKCAHIKTGKKKEYMGVTHLNQKEAAEVEKVLPILADICINILNQKGEGKFEIGLGSRKQ